jgi:uncharacterized SAM-binding protein YcdF (DUF218 family)
VLWLSAIAAAILFKGNESAQGRADAAIILGAAVGPNAPSPVFRERLRHGLNLYRAKRVRTLILTGGFGEQATRAESQVARQWLRRNGVPETSMVIEVRSRTTLQNLTEAKRLMKASKVRTALIVSDPLHMKRAMVMAEDLGIQARPSPTPTSRYRSFGTKSGFLLREVYFLHHYWLFGR